MPADALMFHRKALCRRNPRFSWRPRPGPPPGTRHVGRADTPPKSLPKASQNRGPARGDSSALHLFFPARAPDTHPFSRGTPHAPPLRAATLAQSVELLTCNQGVVGSIPTGGFPFPEYGVRRTPDALGPWCARAVRFPQVASQFEKRFVPMEAKTQSIGQKLVFRGFRRGGRGRPPRRKSGEARPSSAEQFRRNSPSEGRSHWIGPGASNSDVAGPRRLFIPNTRPMS